MGVCLLRKSRQQNFDNPYSPQGRLEIPIKLAIGKGEASDDVFEKMKDFADNNYIEPEKVSLIKSKKDDDVDLL